MTNDQLPDWILARRETIKRHADEVCGQLRTRPVGDVGLDDDVVNFSEDGEE